MFCDDLYKVLKVSVDANVKEIVHSYRKLCLEHHPDKNGGESTDEFIRITEAYKILSDPELREVYDDKGLDFVRKYMNNVDRNGGYEEYKRN